MAQNSDDGFKKSKKNQQQPTTVLFIRHGENEWTESHKLAGRTPGVHLNEYGRQQAEALGKRLADVKLNAIYASPLERTMETAQAIAQHHQIRGQSPSRYPGSRLRRVDRRANQETVEDKSVAGYPILSHRSRFPQRRDHVWHASSMCARD